LIEEIDAVVDLHGVLDLLRAVLSIVVIDLVLSGDNAVVIGMAARLLPPEQRRRAIVLGGSARWRSGSRSPG
jgi:predicted tellurium resistance membrane protein TerC